MKLLLLLLIGFCGANSYAQMYFTQYFDGADTLPYQSLLITTDSTGLWQVGPPQKSVFDSPLSIPNVLVTDTINTLPDSTSASFYFGFNPQTWGLWGIIAVQWAQKLDLDSTNEIGLVEYSVDTGSTWINVFDDPFVYNFYGFQSANDGYHSTTTEHGFIGKDSVWRDIWLCFNYDYFPNYDTVIFKYTIQTDTIEHNSEGWMIDNMMLHETWFHTIVENSKEDDFLSFPTTTADEIKIRCNKKSNPPVIKVVELIDLSGRVVAKFYPEAADFELSLGQYGNGQYRLKIITDQGFDVCPVIIEH